MNNIGQLIQANIATVLAGIFTLVLCVLKYKYNGIKLLKITFYSIVIAEILFMFFMDYGASQIAMACTLSIVLFPELIILISKYPRERTKWVKEQSG